MKKILSTLIFSAVSLPCVFAVDLISKPHRYVELGLDAQVAAANSYWAAGDVLKKDLVIDLQKIAKEMPDDGFSIGFYNREQAFLNVNAGSHFRLSFSGGIESTGNFNISKDLFELLASGLSVDSTKTVDVTGYADVFADMNFSFQTLVNDYAVKIMPTYYVPLVYVPKTTATASISTTSGGAVHGEASANVEIYTAANMHDFVEDNNTNFNISEIMSNGGFDLTLEVERNVLGGLNIGGYGRIPIVPGKLNYKMSTRVYASFDETNVLGYLDESESHTTDHGHDDFTYSEATYKAYRPLKLGLSANWTPLGQWLKISPAVGFAMRDPYSSENRLTYFEYMLNIRLGIWKILFFDLNSSYQNQIFQQQAGVTFNFRVIEIIAKASLASTNFVNSFDLSGAGAFVGFRIGF
ncbi:hypothetical protein [Treponema sp.]|uniref:hypothetical protein n=1 Tax=Treponema sp. TaxID=166 RepID=UPI00388FB6C7